MFVGGLCGFIMDNLIPGHADDRGIEKWRFVQNKTKRNIFGSNTLMLRFQLVI